MVDRVKAAEFSIDKIVRSIDKKKEEFNKKSYYLAFERFKNNLSHIKEYCKNVSKLKGYRRFLLATDVKSKFEQLRDDFDRCMADLNFAYDVSNVIDRAEESQRVDTSLNEVKESLKQLDDKLDEGFKQVDDKLDEGVRDKINAVAQRIDFMQSTQLGDTKKIDARELDDPKKPVVRGKVFKKMYKSFIDVACKPIDGQNENEMAILGKLGLSSQILKFYGHSVVNNSQVMILEWAELGNLRELYEKYDIPWTRKIKIAGNILLGLLFLRTVNVFHHDVRCENVFVLRDLSVKLGNFGCAREVDGNSRNLSSLETYIVRWIAPELIKKYISGKHENKKVYTPHCEMFSFGMLLWELSYEKLPYAEWNIKQICDHVLVGKREKILNGRFRNPDDRKIQLEFIKIIQDAWCHQPELRITIPTLRQRLEDLANKFPIAIDGPLLFREKTLDFDGLNDIEEIIAEDDDILPLENNVSTEKVDPNELIVNPSELIDPYSPIKKFYKGFEVAVKYSKRLQTELSILKKLDISPYILRFYGHAKIDDKEAMIFEWAEHKSLEEFYDSCDITWTRKIKIIHGISSGIMFLLSMNIFHQGIRCKNVFITRGMNPKLGNFGHADKLKNVIRWMSPEQIEKYQNPCKKCGEKFKNTDKFEKIICQLAPEQIDKNQCEECKKKKYTQHCETFSFGMLIWELCYETIPYNNWNPNEISEHVLKLGKREKLLLGKFNNPDDDNIQKGLSEIIDKTWQHIPHTRINITDLNKMLKQLTETYPILVNDQIYHSSEDKYSDLLNEQTIKKNFENEVEKISKIVQWEGIKFMEKIGKGNFGTVNKAYMTMTHEYVACKTLTNTTDINNKQSTAFINELKMHVDLNHCNNIIRFLGVTRDNVNHNYYLVMEFANNGDLYTFLQSNHRLLNWDKKLKLALQIANGLHFLHCKDIIHRDLHDKNILIHNDEVKITDFGHAKNEYMETHVHNKLFGVIPFLAPELIESVVGDHSKTHRASVQWILQVCALELLLK
ncbi:kinase-like protein [Gigaspora margarita]|uniref:Kinase-like protein n=1 Tax=Gigaspora margarita TaxID=4874 RepID=A0A8H4EQR6_GIGMA|nr:kinase-like protein [Gigaspora margarita]